MGSKGSSNVRPPTSWYPQYRAASNIQKNVQGHESFSAAPTLLTDRLLAQLSERQAELECQNEILKASSDEHSFFSVLGKQSTGSNGLPTPITETFGTTAPGTRPGSIAPGEFQASSDEVLRLKLELAQAQNKISVLDQELTNARLASQQSGRGTPAFSSDADLPGIKTELQAAPGFMDFPLNAASRRPFSRDGIWAGQNETRPDATHASASGVFSRVKGIWNNKPASQNFGQGQGPLSEVLPQQLPWNSNANLSQGFGEQNLGYGATPMDAYRHDGTSPDIDVMKPGTGRRGHRHNNNNFGAGLAGYNMGLTNYEVQAFPHGGPGGMGMYQYQQSRGGNMLSPHAAEFTSAGVPWKTEVNAVTRQPEHLRLTSHPRKPLAGREMQTFLPATEPLNYRRLLDRNVTCDWKYIVDKIVCNNDQQASIFLQQKLKVGTPEQKYDIVEAIVAQAYPLMVNRFGNFLVQRCFEHGTPEQVVKIAIAIRGNTLNLSMDPFGCHVIQKAFDSVPEEYKAVMVQELLRRIPETVIHRYACHVWQKLFELRWTETPPKIMKYVNEALRGMWHEVALGETGSLVVQNIFENCLEEDKVSLNVL